MATIKPDGFTIEGLDTIEINVLYEALESYVGRDGTMGLTGRELAFFEAATSLKDMLEEVRRI